MYENLETIYYSLVKILATISTFVLGNDLFDENISSNAIFLFLFTKIWKQFILQRSITNIRYDNLSKFLNSIKIK